MDGNTKRGRRLHIVTVTLDDNERDALIKHARPLESGANVIRRLIVEAPVVDGPSSRLRKRKTS